MSIGGRRVDVVIWCRLLLLVLLGRFIVLVSSLLILLPSLSLYVLIVLVYFVLIVGRLLHWRRRQCVGYVLFKAEATRGAHQRLSKVTYGSWRMRLP